MWHVISFSSIKFQHLWSIFNKLVELHSLWLFMEFSIYECVKWNYLKHRCYTPLLSPPPPPMWASKYYSESSASLIGNQPDLSILGLFEALGYFINRVAIEHVKSTGWISLTFYWLRYRVTDHYRCRPLWHRYTIVCPLTTLTAIIYLIYVW